MKVSEDLFFNIVKDFEKKFISNEEKGAFVNAFIKEHKLTQRQFAKLIGRSHSTVHDWCTNRQLKKYYHKLENKSEEFGIKMERHSEAFTSRTCPICGVEERSHKKDRLFVCSFCDYFDDRDIVGATNIMFIGMHDQNSVRSVHQAETSHLGGMLHGIES